MRSASPRPRRRGGRWHSQTRLSALGLLLMLSCLWGCTSFWEGVRERERQFSLRHAREQVNRGNCGRGLASLERAQASAELGAFEAESIWLKARCLERMGRHEEALAHLRMLGDFYADSTYAASLPESVVKELAAFPLAAAQEAARTLTTPPHLDIPRAHYSRVADRYRLTGSVRVFYTVERNGHTAAFRVVESAHPLLAGWALQALAAAKLEDADDAPQASRSVATGFFFSSKWEDEEEGDGEPWIVFFPESDDS